MPDELYELWLQPFFQREPIPADFTTNPENFNALMVWQNRLNFSFPELMERIWTKDRGRFRFAEFHRDSVWKMESLIRECTTEEETEFANIIDTKDRFWACADYIEREGGIPKSVVFDRTSEGLLILDGHHRIAAFNHLFPDSEICVDYWHSRIRI